MQNKLSYNIIAGIYKGKKLFLPSLEMTRSTKTIIRESVFNTIQYDIIDKNFVEVFGGSGSMGLEALSRGAKRAYFIELNNEVYKQLKENCKIINPNATEIINGDSFREFAHLLSKINNETETIFYFDPPFETREGMSNIYQKIEHLITQIPKEKAFLIVVEHMSKVTLTENIGAFTKIKTKKFGKSSTTYYK